MSVEAPLAPQDLQNDQEVSSKNLNSDQLDAAIMNGDRLRSLREIFQLEVSAGKSEAEAMEAATKSLEADETVAPYLPNETSSEAYAADADRVFQTAEKAMRMSEKEFKAYIDGLNNPKDENGFIRGYDQVDQQVYKNGAKHIYAVESDGKKKHLSHDAVLDAYGYGSRKDEEARIAEDEARTAAVLAAGVAKATPQMIKTAKAMSKAKVAEETPTENGVYGFKGSQLVNNGMDLVGPNPSRDFELVNEGASDGYDGPVKPGMEIELAPSSELVPAAVEAPRVIPSWEGINPISNEGADQAIEAQSRLSLKDRFKNRLLDIRMRGKLLAQGDVRGALGDKEGKIVNKKRMLGAAAVVAAGGLFYANNKYGWGLDVNPLDGDGLDLNPFNAHDGGAQEVVNAGGASDGNEGARVAELLTPVHVDAGEGTSHIARDALGINFDTVDQWNQFNEQTNHLFQGLEGTYTMPDGSIGISAAGDIQIPNSVLEQMRTIAEQVRAGS